MGGSIICGQFTDENDEVHKIGAKHCPGCWREEASHCECGGFVHSWFVDESDDSIILGYKCDKCGERP